MTTPAPLKLTDDVIDELFHNLCGQHERCEAMVTAIRTLRDRARAVVDDADRPIIGGDDDADVEIDKALIHALREVLPEAKP